MNAPAPVAASERIGSIDVLRGFALLGILLLNILGFGLPGAAYFNPAVDGATGGADFVAYAVNWLLFEGAMRAIFSMLFGAGVILMTERADARGARTATIYYRRTTLLIMFGLFDAYLLLWTGDVLYVYGMAGLVLYLFRGRSPRTLLACGAVCLVYLILVQAFLRNEFQGIQATASSANAAELAGLPLGDEQRAALAALKDYREQFEPDADALAEEVVARQRGWWANVVELAPTNVYVQTSFSAKFLIWDALAMMFVGMALYRYGVFSAGLPARVYVRMMVIGYAVGVGVNGWELFHTVASGFAMESVEPQFQPTYEIGRIGCAVGHIGLLMLLCQRGHFAGLRRRLAAVGQMALTNYLTHSLLGVLIFTGAGLGLFGQLPRHQLYFVVLAIWLFQLLFSPWWLTRFRFGPVEWLWRTLTYGQLQSMRMQHAEDSRA